MSPEAPDYLDAYDTLTMRLSQASGILASLEAHYDQPVDRMEHILSPGSMLSALSAVHELIAQARAASEALPPLAK